MMDRSKWNQDRSVVLSQACVLLFGGLLAALDLGCCWLAGRFVQRLVGRWQFGVLFMVSVYAGSVFAWVCLWQLWKLLGNIRRGAVFVSENVGRMRRISWCCVWAGLVCLLSALYYYPFGFVAAAAGFMALIVRIVKNAFQQAIAMKDELDLTV